MRAQLFMPLLFSLAGSLVSAAVDTSAWPGRNIYFIVVDRFAAESSSTSSSPCDGHDWCGGTLAGITEKLPYIAAMGFDAIWVTPIVKQTPWLDNWNGTAYHGYWAADFHEVDPHFGTPEDLHNLVDTAHQLGMLFMLDIVANHVGPLHTLDDVMNLGPGLSDPMGEQFHQDPHPDSVPFADYLLDPLTMAEAGPECYPYYNFASPETCDFTTILDGWFGDLGDLNHENPDVQTYLLDWISYMRSTYGIDGFRLDTALYIPPPFLASFQEAADVYIVGEVVTYNQTLHASYQEVLTGVLNFPITEHIKTAFSSEGDLSFLGNLLITQNLPATGYNDVHLLGNFVDNHDGDRFLYNHTGDVVQLKNAVTLTNLWHGIPITYYGTEVLDVANASDCRTSMWGLEGGWGGGVTEKSLSAMGEFLKGLNDIRELAGFSFGGEFVESEASVVLASTEYLAFSRGELLMLVNNRGQEEGGEDEVCFEVVVEWQGASWVAVMGDGSAVSNGSQICVTTQSAGPLVLSIVSIA